MTHLINLIPILALAQLSPQPTARVIQQDAADWQIHYTFRNPTPDPITIPPADLSARISSPGLSNSRATAPDHPAAHGIPRPTTHTLDGYGAASTAHLHGQPGADASEKCAERASIRLWVGPGGPPDKAGTEAVTVPAGGNLSIRITLAHVHDGTAGLDPLLGRRDVTVTLGGGPGAWVYRDVVDIQREQFTNLPESDWRPMDGIPDGHRDDQTFFSAPYSLILDAGEPGSQYYRFAERRVRGGVRMKISFRYMVAPWCDGAAKIRVAQYKESPNTWRVLSDAGFERTLRKPPPKPNGKRGEVAAGQWIEFAEVFRTDPEATTAAFDLRLSDSEWGVVWVDDFSVTYVGVPTSNVSTP